MANPLPERYGCMSQNLLASDEALLMGGSGTTPAVIPEGQDIVDSDNVDQLYFTKQNFTVANDPTWVF